MGRLRAEARRRRVPMAAIVRDAVDRVVPADPGDRRALFQRAISAIGRFDSGSGDVSAGHDEIARLAMVGEVFVDTEPALHASAQSRYRASLPSGASVVDQVSFGVMAQASIETAFALDSDFVTTGVSIVRAP